MKFEPVEYLELKIDKSKPVPKTYTTLVQNNNFQKVMITTDQCKNSIRVLSRIRLNSKKKEFTR